MQFNMTKGKSAIIKVIGVGGGGSNAVNNILFIFNLIINKNRPIRSI